MNARPLPAGTVKVSFVDGDGQIPAKWYLYCKACGYAYGNVVKSDVQYHATNHRHSCRAATSPSMDGMDSTALLKETVRRMDDVEQWDDFRALRYNLGAQLERLEERE